MAKTNPAFQKLQARATGRARQVAGRSGSTAGGRGGGVGGGEGK